VKYNDKVNCANNTKKMCTEWHANVQVKWNYFFRTTMHNGGSVCLFPSSSL